MQRPEQNDDKYYPFSIKENMEWYISDLECYCDELEKLLAKVIEETNYTGETE